VTKQAAPGKRLRKKHRKSLGGLSMKGFARFLAQGEGHSLMTTELIWTLAFGFLLFVGLVLLRGAANADRHERRVHEQSLQDVLLSRKDRK